MQNLRHSRSPLSATSTNVPGLPTRLASIESYGSHPAQEVSVSWSGPAPPKSWRSPHYTWQDRVTPQWRTEAFKVAALHLGQWISNNHVPSLSLLCLQVILSSYTDNQDFREVVPYIPGHLRRDLIRHCAIHSPLVAWELEALWEPNGHADGEITVVGPTSLREDHLSTIVKSSSRGDSDWELDDQAFTPLHTLIFISTSSSILLTMPPTITALVLIDLSSPQPLHRLPKLCPLLELLDLSYNIWLRDPSGESYGNFERIQWVRWSHLKILGLRECYVTRQQLQRIEEGRWDGINIIY